MHSTTIATLIDGVIGLAVVAGGIVLLALGKVDAPTGVSVIGAGVLAAKGATSAALALKVPTKHEHVTARSTPETTAPRAAG